MCKKGRNFKNNVDKKFLWLFKIDRLGILWNIWFKKE